MKRIISYWNRRDYQFSTRIWLRTLILLKRGLIENRVLVELYSQRKRERERKTKQENESERENERGVGRAGGESERERERERDWQVHNTEWNTRAYCRSRDTSFHVISFLQKRITYTQALVFREKWSQESHDDHDKKVYKNWSCSTLLPIPQSFLSRSSCHSIFPFFRQF